MIAIVRRESIMLMERKTTELETQVEALSAKLSATTDQLGVIAAELAAVVARSEMHSSGIADAERRAETLVSLVADQAAMIMRLDEREERRLELDRRIQADMSRLERQAAIDITEMRETSLALAERLLGRGRSAGTSAAETE